MEAERLLGACAAVFARVFRKPLAMAAFCALLAPAASIGAPPDHTAERERIRQERAQAESLFEERKQECLKSFVVTPCTDKAQRQRRQSLAELKRQENLLDEQLRRQRVADRDEALAEKSRERAQAAQAAAGASAAAQAPQRAPREPRRPAEMPEQVQAQAGQREAERSIKAAEATRRAQAQRGKVEAAARRKAEVESRNAEQARSGKPASPGLPTPPASASLR